jgi:ribosomal protein S18 acetylase RimI-like enzyme
MKNANFFPNKISIQKSDTLKLPQISLEKNNYNETEVKKYEKFFRLNNDIASMFIPVLEEIIFNILQYENFGESYAPQDILYGIYPETNKPETPLIGFARFAEFQPNPNIVIMSCAVDSSYRRQGIASTVSDEFENILFENSPINEIITQVHKDNFASLLLNRKRNLEELPTIDDYPLQLFSSTKETYKSNRIKKQHNNLITEFEADLLKKNYLNEISKIK